jgi:hypothetical protein
MTARHNPDPRPSKRSQRRERQYLRHLRGAVIRFAESDPVAREHLARQAARLTSPGLRALLQRLEWARPQPLRTGIVTWDGRRRRHRRAA